MDQLAFIIAGPQSAGNRLVASILIRSGCSGSSSDIQPQRSDEIPSPGSHPFVIIKHRQLVRWVHALRSAGYSRVVVVVVVREPIANASSLVNRGHVTGFNDAYKARLRTLAKNIADGSAVADEFEIVTFEGLNEEFLSAWLPRLGLPYVSGSLDLPGQAVPESIDTENQNSKHYA